MRSILPLIVTIAVQAIVSLAALVAPVMSLDAAATSGIAARNVGLFVGIIYAAACFSSLVGGALVSRFGAIRMSQISLVLCSGGLIAASGATAPMFALSAMLIGLGYGPVTPASSHILARTTPPHRMGLTFSIKQTGVPLGGMIAGLALPPCIHAIGWQATALVIACTCLSMSVITQIIRRELDTDRNPRHPVSPIHIARQLTDVLAVPAIRDIGLCSFFFGAMQLCLTTFLVLYLTGTQGLSLALAGSVLAIAQVAGIIGRLGWGWLADVFVEPRAMLGLLGLAMGGCGLLFGLAPTNWDVLALGLVAVAFGATAIGWNGVFLAEVARRAPPGRASAATGASLFMTYAGVVVGPPVFAAASAIADFPFAYLNAGLIMMAVGIFLLVRRPRDRHETQLKSAT